MCIYIYKYVYNMYLLKRNIVNDKFFNIFEVLNKKNTLDRKMFGQKIIFVVTIKHI